MAYTRAKRITGGGREAITRLQAVAAAIWDLKNGSSGWQWVTFDSEGSKNPIEIARESDLSDSVIVNIPHRERDGLLSGFDEVGLELPPGWVVTKDKKKGILFGGFLHLSVAPEYQDALSDFVEEAGLKLFGWDQSLSITCSLQKGCP